MEDLTLDRVAKNLTGLMPEFKMLFKPIEKFSKNLSSPLQVHAMFMLHKKKICTMTELSNCINVSKQQLTPIIDKLISNGYVDRHHDENDRRTVKISLTIEGHAYLKTLKANIHEMTKEQLSNLSNEDLITLDKALNDVYNILHKMRSRI